MSKYWKGLIPLTTAQAAIGKLVAYGQAHKLLDELDAVAARNALLDAMALDEPGENYILEGEAPRTPAPILRELLDDAVDRGLIEDTAAARALLDTRLMGCLTPRPSQVRDRFEALRKQSGIKAAVDWFYRLCLDSNYIRADDLSRNLAWTYESPEYGRLEITVNLSKPEKDPRDIERLKSLPPSGYPRCLLCLENMGYAGRLDFPARQTLRVIPLTLNGERWYFQYSPYIYYDEHCIVLRHEHIPMKLDRDTFRRLLDFTGQFPHYFMGSNADLPIVGGSILSHDHFQGGAHVMPMARAPVEIPLSPPAGFKGKAGIVRWPMSAVRLTAAAPGPLVEAADRLRTAWSDHADPGLDILPYSDATPHNTVTPIARRRDAAYELDLVLRNNRTSARHPLGIFHPHVDLHHIKKENIGLIEAMGLFILPGRLDSELTGIAGILSGRTPLDEKALENEIHPLAKHLPWIRELAGENGTCLSAEEAGSLLRDRVGRVCERVLHDAGVYKNTPEGRRGFLRFLGTLGYVPL